MKRKSRMVVLVVVLAGVLAAAAFIAVSATTGAPDATATAARPSASYLAGVPQHGLVLGSPHAPVTLVEFADLQCPYCGRFAREAMPTIVRDYVRTGKVGVVFAGLEFLGPDSDTALRAVLAAARHNRGWDVIDALFQRQGAENTGWVTGDLLREIAAELDGVDARTIVTGSTGDREIVAAQRLAARHRITGTPSFLAGRTGGRLSRVTLSSLSADALRPVLDNLLDS